MQHGYLRKHLITVLILVILPVLFFWRVTVGGKTLLPADNVFAWEPWKSYAKQVGITVPYNDLLSDLYLQNYVWKRFIINSLRDGQLPLWNPYLFAGVPFLAAGQHSALYPFSVLFYLLPLPNAYGWFAALHLFLAGLFMYLLARTLRVGWLGSVLAAATFTFSGFMITNNVFPMIVGSLAWLPLILAMIERVVTRAEKGVSTTAKYIPDLVIGALAFGMVFLAGHAEMYYYVCLSSAFFALWRLGRMLIYRQGWRRTAPVALGLVSMVLVGFGLGGIQWLPYLQLLRTNFREGSASFKEVLGWAFPWRQIISFLIPDFYGNPTHHSYFDLFTWRTVPTFINAYGQLIDKIFWGMKNYVEAAAYIGVLPFLLALIGMLRRQGRHIWFFTVMTVVSLLFVFGSPLYIVIYKLPGMNQVHSPYRWTFFYTLCMSILAGMGVEVLANKAETEEAKGWWRHAANQLAEKVIPRVCLFGAVITLVGLAVSLPFKRQFADWSVRAVQELARAAEAFANGGIFYSYEFRNLLIFGVLLLVSSLVLVLRHRFRQRIAWGLLALVVGVGDLFWLNYSFFPAVDTKLIGFRTPAIDFLTSDRELYRITSYGGDERTFNANAGMLYDIADVRGYDSVIPKQYVEYMRLIQEQTELLYNRIAPIFATHPEALDSPLLDMLNVKYVLTTKDRTISNAGYTLVYDGEIRIYRNEEAMSRAFLVAKAISIPDAEERRKALTRLNPREVVILEETPREGQAEDIPSGFSPQAEVIHYTPNEVTIVVDTPIPSFLVLGDSFFPGWRAFIHPFEAGGERVAERETYIYRANGNFRAVQVPAGHWVVHFRYSPSVVRYGMVISGLAVVALALSLGWWARTRLRPEQGAKEEHESEGS